MDQKQLYVARRRMGMLFQFGALFADLSVFENVAFPLREHTDLPESLIRDIVLMKLNAVGLRGARDLMPSEVSGGMARRIALARAIALDPELVMVDEPFSGLDPISLRTTANLIRQLTDSMGLTCILVSHEIRQTLAIADHVVDLGPGAGTAGGTICFEGTVAELRTSGTITGRHFDDRAALKRLSGRKYILTNAPRDYTMRVLSTLRLADLFDGVISIEDMHMFGDLRPKPDARMFRHIAAKLKAKPSDCVLVEDTLENQKAARGVGMRTAWMQRYLEGRYRGHLRGGQSCGVNAGSQPREVGVHACPSPRYVCAKIKSLQQLLTLR